LGDLSRRELIRLGAATCLAAGASAIFDAGCGSGSVDTVSPGASSGATVHAILGDELDDLYRMGTEAAQILGIHAGRNLSGARVFIKPNLFMMGFPGVTFQPTNGMNTKAEIVAGIAEQCLLAGADKVTIGDASQGIRWDWKGISFIGDNLVFGTRNLHDAVERLRASYPNQEIELACLNDLDQWEMIPSSSDSEIMREGLKVAKSFCEADVAISVPVLKTHMWADITCAMKNYVGVVTSKPPFGSVVVRDQVHEAYKNAACAGFENVGIAGCFLDIYRWRKQAGKQDVAIIDCTVGLEANGPLAGPGLGKGVDLKQRSPAGKYFLLASDDLAAADATAVRVMNQEVDQVKQLLMARALGLGEIDRVTLNGSRLEALRVPDWEFPSFTPAEWGPASTMPLQQDESSGKNAQAANFLAAFLVPTSIVYLWKHLHRNLPADGAGRP
jgi:uncharacterized protein (DUF362 family)